jgi:hypothetical protein
MNSKEIIFLIIIVLGAAGCLYFIRLDWKRFGAIYLISVISGNLLCYMFTFLDFYTFPNNILHKGFLIPYGLVSTVFPLIAMFGIRYSPVRWVWKIPFYWGIVHIGVLAEVILKQTEIFAFKPEWDLWDSYTLWWLNYLLFELLGGKMIPSHLRKPINSEAFKYGNWAWIVFHIIVITTIFLAGVYVGITVFRE